MALVERDEEGRWVTHKAERGPRRSEPEPEPQRIVDVEVMFRKLDEGRQADAGRGEPGL